MGRVMRWQGPLQARALSQKVETHRQLRRQKRFLKYAFKTFCDAEKTKGLGRPGLQHALATLKLPAGDDDADKLFKLLKDDKDESDVIHLNEWVERLPFDVTRALHLSGMADDWSALS